MQKVVFNAHTIVAQIKLDELIFSPKFIIVFLRNLVLHYPFPVSFILDPISSCF